MVGCCAEACTAIVLIGVMRLPGCPFGSAAVGLIGLIVGVSCLLCSSALPGVWSFLRVTPCAATPGDTIDFPSAFSSRRGGIMLQSNQPRFITINAHGETCMV